MVLGQADFFKVVGGNNNRGGRKKGTTESSNLIGVALVAESQISRPFARAGENDGVRVGKVRLIKRAKGESIYKYV